MKRVLCILIALLLTTGIVFAEPVATPTPVPTSTATADPTEAPAPTPTATANPTKTPAPVPTPNPVPSKIVIDAGTSVTVNLGERFTIPVTLSPAGAASSLKWSTSNKKVAKVTSSGVIVPQGKGTCKITVKTVRGGRTDRINVKVVDPTEPTGIKLSPSGTIRMNVGEKLTITRTLTPATAISTTKWTTSNSKVVSVDKGKLTAKKEGTCRITAMTTRGKKKASVVIKVSNPYKPSKITLTPSGTITMNIGEKLTVSHTLSPATASSTVKWTSSNSKVVSVDKGKLTAKKEGTAKIKAVTTVGKKSAYLTVRVKDPKKPTSIRLNATGKKTMRIGERFQVEYTLTPSTAQSSIIWVSSNKNVAGVTSTGVVKAKKKGTATITAKTKTGGKKASFVVTVLNQPAVTPTPSVKPTTTPSVEPTATIAPTATVAPTVTPSPKPTAAPAPKVEFVPAPSKDAVPDSVGMSATFKSATSTSIYLALNIQDTINTNVSGFGVIVTAEDGTSQHIYKGSVGLEEAVYTFSVYNLKPNTEYTIVGYAIMNGKEYRSSGFRTKTLDE